MLCRDENGERKKTAENIRELAREAKQTERGEGVGGGSPCPMIGASEICPSKLRILVDLKM